LTTSSSNLKLTLYNNSSDQSGSFLTWTRNMSGSSNSNMTKIDEWAGGASGSVTNLSSSFSGSLTAVNNLITSLSGSITTINSNITTLQSRMTKLYEFSGAGKLDFNNIPQTHTHLLIFGVAKCNISGTVGDVGIDFNGDANSANYSSLQWYKNTLAEYITSSTSKGGIWLGSVGGTSASNYPGMFLALIPNYSSTASIYKVGMGIGLAMQTALGASNLNIQGGAWLNTDAITRIRIFGLSGTSYRYSFLTGTKITVYGFGG